MGSVLGPIFSNFYMSDLENKCYGEIGNHHRNSLNEELCHRSPDRDTRRDTLDRTREEQTLSL